MNKEHFYVVVSKILLHLFFWGLLLYIFSSSFTLKYARVELIEGKRQIVTYTKNLFSYVLVIVSFKASFIYLLLFKLLHKFSEKLKGFKGILFMCSMLVVLTICEYLVLLLLTTISSFTVAEIKLIFPVNLLLSGLCMGIAFAYFFIGKWNLSQQKIQMLTNEQLRSELSLLKAQVAPHFLFNTLNNFFSMAQKEGNGKLAEKISVLSDFMRYLLKPGAAKKVALQTEINFVCNYIEIMKLNYSEEEVQINFSTADFPNQVMIVPMMLIPFVENAFKYGVYAGTKSVIDLSLELKDDNMLVFKGSNPDYSKLNRSSLNSFGIGMDSVSQKLHLHYTGSGSLTYDSTAGLFTFELKIPAYL